MLKKTYLKRSSDMKQLPLSQCHNGVGNLQWTEVINFTIDKERKLNFFHDDILRPGVSIGIHRHEHDEEYYYIISGKGIITLDGNEFEVVPGDITAVYPGGSHGLKNHTDSNLRIIVVSVS